MHVIVFMLYNNEQNDNKQTLDNNINIGIRIVRGVWPNNTLGFVFASLLFLIMFVQVSNNHSF